MNDDDLRGRFDVLVARVPPNADAGPLVRVRADRIRRRRAGAAVSGLTLVVAAAVAVPQTLQHQAKSHRQPAEQAPSIAPSVPAASHYSLAGLRPSCTGQQVAAAGQLGVVDSLYGEQTNAAAALAWGGPGAAARFQGLSPDTAVDLCLIVGSLGRAPSPAGGETPHYALQAIVAGAPVVLYSVVDFAHLPPLAMPGVGRALIGRYHPRVAEDLIRPSAEPSRTGPLPSPDFSATRPCTSDDLDATFSLTGVRDGAQEGNVDVVNLSTTPCSVAGDLDFAALSKTGTPLPGHPHGVVAVTPVRGVLYPKGALVVEVGGDQPAGPCTKADLVTPVGFMVTVGSVTAVALNWSQSTSVPEPRSLAGCPGTVYADAAAVL